MGVTGNSGSMRGRLANRVAAQPIQSEHTNRAPSLARSFPGTKTATRRMTAQEVMAMRESLWRVWQVFDTGQGLMVARVGCFT
jgi:hypothetical protein